MSKLSIYKFILFITFIALLTGCGKIELPFIPESGVILAFGDSLTDGKGVTRPHSYPAILSQLSQRKVINAGISGEVTSDGLIRLTEILDDTHPDLIILLEGGNDILQNHHLATTKKNLAAMISLAKSKNISILLIGVPEKQLFSKSASIYQELAEEYQLILMDSLISNLLKSPSYKSDQIHFNEKGYRLMAEEIYQVLHDHGAF